MARIRFVIVLPVLSLVITLLLGIWSRQQYQSLLGRQADGTWVGWTDYTPISLDLAGALNVPVANFGYPLYHLLRKDANTWVLIALFGGIGLQWAYVGWMLDRKRAFRPSSIVRIGGGLGVLFGIFTLVLTIPMHHVSIIYKSAGLLWSFGICFHSITLITLSKRSV